MPKKKGELEKHGVTVPMIWLIISFASFAGWISLMHFNDRAEMKDRISNEADAINVRIDGLIGNVYQKINKNKEAIDVEIAKINKTVADETMRSTIVDNTQDKVLTKMDIKLEATSDLAKRTAAEAGIRHSRRMHGETH